MSEEIKEILDNIQTVIDEGHYRATCDIDYEECKLLLDYITNLQEENERLKDCYRNNYFKYRNKVYDGRIILKQRDDYKSRNEKANALLDEMLEKAYIDGKYIMYDYSTSELLEVKQALEGENI